MSGRPQHGEGQALALRWEEGVLGDVARGTGPRERSVDRSMARDRPSPYGGVAFFIVARGTGPATLSDL